MSTPDISANPSHEHDFELSELDKFGLTLRDTLDLLDDRHTTPATDSIEVTGLPFGRFNESKLSCHLWHANKQTGGKLYFKSTDDPTKSLLIERDSDSIFWTFPGGSPRTNRDLLRILDRSWPLATQNDDLSMYANIEEPSDQDVIDCALSTVAPYASDVIRERTYEFTTTPAEDAVGKDELTEQLILQRKDDNGLTTVHALLEIPYQVGLTKTTLTCVVSSDELGTTTLTAHYTNTETGEITTLPVASETALLEEFNTMIAHLLDEKLLDANSL